MKLTGTEQRVLDRIDLQGLLATLGDLIAIRSLTGQEDAAQQYVAERMRQLGMEVDVWEVDLETLKKHPAFSAEIERMSALGVVGWMGRTSASSRTGRSLILNGHVDVVPPGDESNWRFSPWQATIDDGRVYGRGACDMKGGLACALSAAQAIRDAGVRLAGRLMIEPVVSEEDGGTGALAAIERGYRADGAVLIEPTEMAIAPVQAGALSFKVTIPGLSAHGCVREEGTSAIDKFIPVYQALLHLEKTRNESIRDPLYSRYHLPYALCIGRLEAGDWPSSVADWLTFQGRYGIIPGEDIAEARRQFEGAVAAAAQADPWLRQHPPAVEWWGGQFAPARIPTGDPLVETLSAAFAEANDRPARLEGMTYGSDMRLLVNEGNTPAVLFGPGDVRRSHKPDEFVPVDELLAVTRTLALTALRFCGHD